MRQAVATTMHMASCERWLEAVSALADGEDPGIDVRLVEAHVARCSQCRTLRDRLGQLPGWQRPGAAGPMPDLSRRIVALNAVADRASRWAIVRWLLAALAAVIIALSFRSLAAAEADIGAGHSMRHLGAFTLAYGVALLLVVVRPARARTVLPVAATLALALAISGVVDIVDGQVPLSNEALLHLPEILSVALVWLLAMPSLRRGDPAAGGREPPSLQIVDDPPPEEPGRRAI
jgi:predicted anti-sigma-YlaC factor YlaD